ncbi:MAG: hypothetical protein ABFS17_10035 [Chloroflexota bacterium]
MQETFAIKILLDQQICSSLSWQIIINHGRAGSFILQVAQQVMRAGSLIHSGWCVWENIGGINKNGFDLNIAVGMRAILL